MIDAIAELILQNEKNDFRFEQFCQGVLSLEEGVTYVPTSQSWDMGRDGRTLGRSRGSHANILCVTLNQMLDAKVEADLLRLTAIATPDRVVYCSSQKLSEHAIDIISSAIRRHVPNGSIVVLGATLLAALSAKHYPVLEKFYNPEILDLKNTVFTEQPTGAASKGLRLALIGFGSNEGADLRHEVLYATLLDRLDSNVSAGSESIAASFSLDLGLPKSLPQSFIDGITSDAQLRGDILFVDKGWRLTSQGSTKRTPFHWKQPPTYLKEER
ncbi:hypothetical protein [Tunturiibacter gelidiferens]|uniref:hypothetical protein n=1 Tax=Tunturiibacter gelidiferens TaxID=3069689 RepID=UPI003D9B8D5D